VDLGAPVIADEQPLEVVQPGEGAFDNPAVTAEPGTVAVVAVGDQGFDATLPECSPVRVGVVAAVAEQRVGPGSWATDAAAHRGHGLDERDQLLDVVAVAARDRPGERDPGRVDQEMVFRPVSGSINRARARRGAPFFACT
jgi:hypothetical protein